MIAQVLNKDYIESQLSALKKDLDNARNEVLPTNRRGLPEHAQALQPSDYQAAFEAIAAAESAHFGGQPSFDAISSRRAGVAAPSLDDYSYFCRNHVVSLVQSAIERYYREVKPEALVKIAPPNTGRRGPPQDIPVTDLQISTTGLSGPPRRIFDKFSITDIRWVSSWIAEGIRLFKGKHPFPAKPASPRTISDRARILLVGDWGTGLPRAKKVSFWMRKELDQGKASNLEQHVIHLGDVYYSGWKSEYRDRFLAADCWPVSLQEADIISSWSLNGNHDMYSGGHAYFDVLLADPRFKCQEKSSYFSLSNNYWEIIGMDTAWDDGDLKDPQADWIMSKVTQSTRNIMLLSHHQPFSAYDSGYSKLKDKLKAVLETNHVRAWFWGHEHRCMFFDPYENVPAGRCLGHGGVPVYMWHEKDAVYPPPGIYEYRDYLQKGLERWGLFGFAVLDFEGTKIRVRYIDENGNPHQHEIIQ
jgi:hypothetical protein